MIDAPRAMRLETVRVARREMLRLPHIAPLTDYAADLRARLNVEVPEFDPLDGGVNARILFLKEKPGPMTSASRPGRVGSGFISRDNDDPTAEATFRFMAKAGIPREAALMWNVVPGWNGRIAISAQERRDGVTALAELRSLLPNLKAIVLIGREAQRAEKLLVDWDVGVFRSFHPSRRVQNSRREEWERIPSIWADAARAAGVIPSGQSG